MENEKKNRTDSLTAFPMRDQIYNIKKSLDIDDHNLFQSKFQGDLSSIDMDDPQPKVQNIPHTSERSLLSKKTFGIPKKVLKLSVPSNVVKESETTFLNDSSNSQKETKKNFSIIKKTVSKLKNKLMKFRMETLKQFHFDLLNDKAYWKETSKRKNFLPWTIWHPLHPFIITIKLMTVFLLLFLFIYVPLDISFGHKIKTNYEKEALHKIFLSFLIFEMIIKLNLGYFFNGTFISNRAKITTNYLKETLLIDLIGIFSVFTEFIYQPNPNDSFNPNSMFKYLIFLKASQFKRLYSELALYFKLELKIKGAKEMIEILCMSLFLAHFIACFWYLTTDLSQYYFFEEEKKVWLSLQNLQERNWQIQYLYSFYWAVVVMMTVGFGDIAPTNEIEVAFCIVAIFVGCAMYGYNINKIGLILQQMYQEENEFKEEFRIINNFLERKKIETGLQSRIKEYLKFIWNEKKTQHNDKEMEIINTLSTNLREELLLESYGGILRAFPMLYEKFSEKSLKHMENETDDCCLYYINRGTVEFFLEGNHNDSSQEAVTKVPIDKKHEGQVFGEFGFFTGRSRVFSAKSKDFVSIFAIKRQDFINIIQNNSKDYEEFCMIKDTFLFNKENSFLVEKCPSCLSITHDIFNCKILHYVPDREKVIKRYDFSHFQEKCQNFKRKNRTKINPLVSKEFNFLNAIKIQKKLKKKSQSWLDMKKMSYYNEFESFVSLSWQASDLSANQEEGAKQDEVINEIPPDVILRSDEDFKEVDLQDFRKVEDNKSCSSKKSRPKSPTLQPHNNNQEYLESSRNINIDSQINYKDSSKNNINPEKNITTRVIDDMLGFEKCENFENYFPESNYQQVLKNVNRERLRNVLFKKMDPLKETKANFSCVTEKFLPRVELSPHRQTNLQDLGRYSFFAQHYKEKITERKRGLQFIQTNHNRIDSSKKISRKSPFFQKYLFFNHGFSFVKLVENLISAKRNIKRKRNKQ